MKIFVCGIDIFMNFREFVDLQEGCELFLSCDRNLEESVAGAIGSAWNIGSGLARTAGGVATGVSGVMDNNRDRRSQAWKDIKGGVRQVFIGNPKASAPAPSSQSIFTPPAEAPAASTPSAPSVAPAAPAPSVAPAAPAPSVAPAAPAQARKRSVASSGASSVYTDDQAPPGWNELVDRWASADSAEDKKAIQKEMKDNPAFKEYYGFAKLAARYNSANSPQEHKQARDEMSAKYADLLGRWEMQRLGKKVQRDARRPQSV